MSRTVAPPDSTVFQAVLKSTAVATLLTITPMLISGCARHADLHTAALSSWREGAVGTASAQIRDAVEYADRDNRHLLQLDQAMIELQAGDARSAEGSLRSIRDHLDYLKQTDLSEEVQSLLTDAEAKAWQAHDYEYTMLLNNVLLASMMNDGFDTFAWSLQLQEHLRRSLTDPESDPSTGSEEDVVPTAADGASPRHNRMRSTPRHPLAFSSYLSGVVQSEFVSRREEGTHAVQLAAHWNNAVSSDSESEALPAGLSCSPGHGAVHIIVYRGTAPRWQEVSVHPTSEALLIADRILSATGKHSLPPSISAVKIAEPELPPAWLTSPCSLSATANTSTSAQFRFHLFADLYPAACSDAAANRDREIARAICRRVVKKTAIVAAKEFADVEKNAVADIGFNILGVLWEASEKADTRRWSTLPAQVLTAAAELPSGDCTITLTAGTDEPVSCPIRVENGKNTVILVSMPQDEISSVESSRSQTGI